MPYKDEEKRKARHREWSKEKIAAGYGKWLYKRRKAFQQDAANFRQALEEILAVSDDEAAQEIAEEALQQSDRRWNALREERKTIQ